MDDFPRNIGDYVGKYNIDASVWGFFFTDAMLNLASTYENIDSEFIKVLKNRSTEIKNNISSKLLNPKDFLFKDKLTHIKTKQEIFSPHLGYPNLFPLLFGLIENNKTSPELNAILNFISDETSVWTPYGIRSLSKKSEFFGIDSNYWRGPIWININYLILKALKNYYIDFDPLAKNIYENLRKNLISTICREKLERGYFFEHFNQNLDGRGAGNHPFNGWTSLVTLMISEQYN